MAKMHHRNMLGGGGFERRVALESSGVRELFPMVMNNVEEFWLRLARLRRQRRRAKNIGERGRRGTEGRT